MACETKQNPERNSPTFRFILRAILSYEYDYRNIPAHVERQMLFLLSRANKNPKDQHPCWDIKKCPPKTKKQCSAWEFHSGDLCWLVNGTIYCNNACKDGQRK